MPRYWFRQTATFTFFTCLLLLTSSGCDSQKEQQAFSDEASAPPKNITRTDAGGRIISEDTDDWRTAPAFVGKVRVEPAFPNPTQGELVTVQVFVQAFGEIQGGIRLRARRPDPTDGLLLLDEIPSAADPGVYALSFPPLLLTTKGLHRLFLFDGFGEIISYGDLELN